MAEQEEKSNFMTIVIGVAVASIVLVLLLKSRETDHLELAGASTTLEGNASALHEAKRFKNDFN